MNTSAPRVREVFRKGEGNRGPCVQRYYTITIYLSSCNLRCKKMSPCFTSAQFADAHSTLPYPKLGNRGTSVIPARISWYEKRYERADFLGTPSFPHLSQPFFWAPHLVFVLLRSQECSFSPFARQADRCSKPKRRNRAWPNKSDCKIR
jgi:hypothetical protein